MNLPPLAYFFPKYGRPEPPDIDPDLTRKFLASQNRSMATAQGPNGLKGTIFSYFPNTIVQYDEHVYRHQKFVSHDDRGEKFEFYILVHSQAHSTDFQRPSMLPGTPVELQHGEWMIPLANPLLETCVIPYFDATEDGSNWYKEYKEDYKEATNVALELSSQAREMMVKGEDGSFELEEDEFRHLVKTMIGVNYDLTLFEMVALRLFDASTYVEMLNAFIDVPATMKALVALETQGEANGENPFVITSDTNDTDSGEKDT